MKNNEQLENKYFLSQAMSYFSGALILALLVNERISEQGFTVFNDISIAVIVILVLTSMVLCYSACLRHCKQIIALARGVSSKWGSILLIFFAFTWIMNINKMVTQQVIDWQIYLFSAIGLILTIVNIIFIWRRPQ